MLTAKPESPNQKHRNMTSNLLKNLSSNPSGGLCTLHRIRRDLIPRYYFLAFPKNQEEPITQQIKDNTSRFSE